MKKIGEILTSFSALIILFSTISINFTTNSKFIFFLNIIQNLYFELIIIFIVGILLILKKKFDINNKIEKYYTLFKLNKSLYKYLYFLIIFTIALITSYNIYFFLRARAYYYKNFLFSTIEIKAKYIEEAKEYEKNGFYIKAINNYKNYLKINEKDNDTYFLKNKIHTLENRVKYANKLFTLSQKEYNNSTKMYSQKGISLLLLSYTLYPENSVVKKKLLTTTNNLTKKIEKSLNKIDNNILIQNDNLLGNEIIKQLTTGNYGRPIPVDTNSLNILLNKTDKNVLKKYIINSWKYYDLIKIRDTIANILYSQ